MQLAYEPVLMPEYMSSTNYPPLPEKALAEIEHETPLSDEEEVEELPEPPVPLVEEEDEEDEVELLDSSLLLVVWG